MLKNLFALTLLSLLLIACRDWTFPPECDDCDFVCLQEGERNVFTNNCPLGFTCDFEVFENAKVDVNQPGGVGKGNKVVFRLTTFTEGVINIADDEVRNITVFEMNPENKTFYVSPENAPKINAHLKRECFCPDVKFVPLEVGCVAGEEQANGIWLVYGKFSFPYSYGNEEVKFEARFDRVVDF